jgi:hypothetical protein
MFWTKRPTGPRDGAYFISHAYADHPLIPALTARLPASARPVVFPPIEVAPDQRVSDDIIKAIEKCRGLIRLGGDASARSFWVAFERDYALRRKKEVFDFDVSTGAFHADQSQPPKLPIYASCKRQDQPKVKHLQEWLEANRSFSFFNNDFELMAGDVLLEHVQGGIADTLVAGGCAVVFLSETSIGSPWMEHEATTAMKQRPDHVLLAWLTDPAPLAARLPDMYRDTSNAVVLMKEGAWDWNRVDDLIVRAFYLLYRNGELLGEGVHSRTPAP